MITNETFFTYNFGIVNGFHFTTFLFVILYSFFYIRQSYEKNIAIVFGLVCINFLCFLGWTISYQFARYLPVIEIYPQWFATISKFCIPFIVLVSSHFYYRNISIKSFNNFHLVDKYKTLITFNHIMCFVFITALCFINDPRISYIIDLTLLICVGLIASFITHQVLNKTRIGKQIQTLILIVICIALFQLYLMNALDLKVGLIDVLLQLLSALIYLVVCLSTIRFGNKEVRLYFKTTGIEKHSAIQGIYNAIENNEFFLVYQPKFSLNNDTITGAEAFLRWKHPTKGILSPKEFISIAEKTNMMRYICFISIDEMVKQAKVFQDINATIPISLNISSQNIHPKTIKYLNNALKKHQINPKNITLEFNESFLMEPSQNQMRALKMLQETDIKISLDDYGTGFSSLRFLKELKLSEIKIDYSFIKGLHENSSNLVIVKSTIEMIKGLNIKSIAEGVENNEIKKILKQIGCDEIQGNEVSKPMKGSALVNWLSKNDFLIR